MRKPLDLQLVPDRVLAQRLFLFLTLIDKKQKKNKKGHHTLSWRCSCQLALTLKNPQDLKNITSQNPKINEYHMGEVTFLGWTAPFKQLLKNLPPTFLWLLWSGQGWNIENKNSRVFAWHLLFLCHVGIVLCVVMDLAFWEVLFVFYFSLKKHFSVESV